MARVGIPFFLIDFGTVVPLELVPMHQFECVVPILSVKNFAVSMDYYVDKLGFTKKWDWGEPPSFGCVARGKIEIFLSEGGQG